jgi:hypothetical protein
LQLPFKALTGGIEMALSRRGLPVTFFAIAAALALITCLRPPLAQDISSLRVPLGVWKPGKFTPEQIRDGSGGLPADSAGLFLLALCAAGMVVGWLAPKRFPQTAGLLLCGAIVAVTAITVNHPALIQLLDRDYEQREQIVSMVQKLSTTEAVVNRGNGRVSEWDPPAEDEWQADLVRGWIYLRYGMWLVFWAVMGIVLMREGSLRRRLGSVGAWALLGAVVACAVCFPRLYAEYKWYQAQRLEARCDYGGSRTALAAAVSWCPEFNQLERTWLLSGKLDWREGRLTPQQRYFCVYQVARDKARPQAYATVQDLPWLITDTKTYREGGPPNAGFELLGNPIQPPSTLHSPDVHRGQYTPHGALTQTYEGTHKLELRAAPHLADELFAEAGDSQPVVRYQASRVWTDKGLTSFTGEKVPYVTGREYALEHRELIGSYAAWQKAAQLDPSRRDCTFYLAVAEAAVDRERPQQAQARMATALAGLSDLPMNAYIMSTLGDAYHEAGQMSESRRCYARSYDVFNLPKKINIHAQKALGGL